ncbi:hypothetical protein GGX14DRAFT_581243 [Mycena pura]|uniref:Uncharacterized protein n=1 Tax=Mycena pura TaxID=153505 RepID=A0AAD6UK27_9AGAR|nr:hypothetical protein GGX14DRAFT_581243 [Mycena pura]
METPASAEINVGLPNPSGITLVLNFHGNGPFTVNLNWNTALEDPPINPLQTPRRGVSTVHRGTHTPRRSVARTTPYSWPSHARRPPSNTAQLPLTTARDNDLEVPETPHSQYELLCNAPPGAAASDEHGLPPLQLVASPVDSPSSVTESDSSVTEDLDTLPPLNSDDAFFGVTDSQVDAEFGPMYLEKCTKKVLVELERACIEFNKQEEEEGSQD